MEAIRQQWRDRLSDDDVMKLRRNICKIREEFCLQEESSQVEISIDCRLLLSIFSYHSVSLLRHVIVLI